MGLNFDSESRGALCQRGVNTRLTRDYEALSCKAVRCQDEIESVFSFEKTPVTGEIFAEEIYAVARRC
jgi:hypothetical protein